MFQTELSVKTQTPYLAYKQVAFSHIWPNFSCIKQRPPLRRGIASVRITDICAEFILGAGISQRDGEGRGYTKRWQMCPTGSGHYQE